MNIIKPVTLGLASLLVAACIATQPGQLAATDNDDYGIGGTGIVGTLSGFGSIFVNGVEVEIGPQTRLTVNGQGVQDHPFSIGETVEILAADANPHTHALRLNIRHQIIGPLADWDPVNGIAVILDQKIQFNPGDDSWRPGQTLAVSGYTDASGIIQARHSMVLKERRILLRGEPERIKAQIDAAGYRISNPSVLDAATGPIRLTARWQDSLIDIQQVSKQPLLPYARVRHWKIEGFAHRYRQHWRQIDTLTGSADIDQPMMFEVRFDEAGQVLITGIDRSGLPRGDSQSRSPITDRKASPAGRSRSNSTGGQRNR